MLYVKTESILFCSLLEKENKSLLHSTVGKGAYPRVLYNKKQFLEKV